MKKQLLGIGVVMMTLSASVGSTLVLPKSLKASQAKPETQEVRASTSNPEPSKKEPERELKPWLFKIGQSGQLYRIHRYYYKIESVLSAEKLLVTEDASPTTLAWSRDSSVGGVGAVITPVRFVVEIPTEGLVDGKRVDVTGQWEVADTIKVDGSTLFVLRRPR
jgi:hypothetical protein